MKFAGSNSRPAISGLEPLEGKTNYFVGNECARWRTGVPTFAKVQYRNLYPGIDLVFYGNPQQLEFDFVVAAGADLSAITLAFDGLAGESSGLSGEETSGRAWTSLRIDARGDLLLKAPGGEIRLRKPAVYQVRESPAHARAAHIRADRDDTGKHLLGGHYVLRGNGQVGFEAPAYDVRYPLIIDPVLSYSTYLGGSGNDFAYAVAVDASGSAYVTGYTYSLDFPTLNPLAAAVSGTPDVFVAKINPQGAGLEYATYLGGSGEDSGLAIAVDALGRAQVTGYTNSTDFPTTSPASNANRGQFDAFATGLSPDGNALVYSRYLGGSGEDYGYGIALDSLGNAYVAGITSSTDFPTTAGALQVSHGGSTYDGFVARINTSGAALDYSTYLGGSGDDFAVAIATDTAGGAIVTGYTDSSDFPTLSALQPTNHGLYDAFITRLNSAGTGLVYSSYLGGSEGDFAYAIAVDSMGRADVTGYTVSADFPVTPQAFQPSYASSYDAFVTRLNADGTVLDYSTYLGGLGAEVAYGIAVDTLGSVYVTGYNQGGSFPTRFAFQPTNRGFYDAVFAKLTPEGLLAFSTYLGGTGNEQGRAVAVDSSGDTYIAGGTFSSDFPTTPDAFQPLYGDGAFDGFVAKISAVEGPEASIQPAALSFTDQMVGSTSPAQTVTVTNSGSAPLTLTSAAISGEFNQSNTCSVSIPPGGRCTVGVSFTPAGVGLRTGSLTLTDNSPQSPHTIALSGTGLPGYTLAASVDSTTVMKGTDSATFVISLQAQSGFTGTVNLACAIPPGMPAANCSFTPASINPGETGTLTVKGISASPRDSFDFTVTGTSGSLTASIPLRILIGDFSVLTSPASASIAAGQSARFTLSVNATNLPEQELNFNCNGVPQGANCSFSPALVRLSGSTSTTAGLTVKTTAASVSSPPMNRPPGPQDFPWLLFCLILLGLIALTSCARSGWHGRLILAAAVLIVAIWTGCGGSGDIDHVGPVSGGTPPGTYTLTLNATCNALTRSATVKLTVE